MGLFDRIRGRGGHLHPASSGRRDPSLTMLSVDEAAWLTSLVRRAFAENGRETTPDGAGGLRGDGSTYGLHNLAAHLSGVGRRAWPSLARRHVEDMLAADRTPSPRSLDEIRDRLLVKLRPVGDLPPGVAPYAPEVLPGLVPVAAVDYPTHVSELLDPDCMDPLGGWDAVAPVALDNLRMLPPPESETVRADQGEPTSDVHVLVSDDFFGAARVCVLEHVLATVLRIERPRHGVLVAVPNRHVLVLHVPRGPGLAAALATLAVLAQGESRDVPGPVSPFVYLTLGPGPSEQVTLYDTDGDLVVDASAGLGELFREFGVG